MPNWCATALLCIAIGLVVEVGQAKPTRLKNNIRQLRFAAAEMTQAQLAQRVGVTRQTIIAIERSKYSPSLEVSFKIARVFDTSVDAVFEYYPESPDNSH